MRTLLLWAVLTLFPLQASSGQKGFQVMSRLKVDEKRHLLIERQIVRPSHSDAEYRLTLMDEKGKKGETFPIYSVVNPIVKILRSSPNRTYVYVAWTQQATEAEILLAKGIKFYSKWGDLSKGGIRTTFLKNGGAIIRVARAGHQEFGANHKYSRKNLDLVYRFDRGRIRFVDYVIEPIRSRSRSL